MTLTFSDAFLPPDNSIRTFHLQDTWKRLRNQLALNASFFDGDPLYKISYYAAGEYGDNYGRVHYHACLFGLPLKLLKLGETVDNNPLFRSQFLESVWPWGHVTVAEFNFDTAAYVSRYITKKVLGDHAANHYDNLGIEPERAWMSKGIGRDFYDAYSDETWRDDYIVTSSGHKMLPPKTYMRWLEHENLPLSNAIKKSRELDIEEKRKKILDIHSGRSYVSEVVKLAQLRNGKLDFGR